MKRLLLAVLASLTLAWPAGATWSIVVVNRRTGEVAIGGATCLASTDLTRIIPAVAVGIGGGCAQATGNSPNSGRNAARSMLSTCTRSNDSSERISRSRVRNALES